MTEISVGLHRYSRPGYRFAAFARLRRHGNRIIGYGDTEEEAIAEVKDALARFGITKQTRPKGTK